jgi:hypothetical protein
MNLKRLLAHLMDDVDTAEADLRRMLCAALQCDTAPATPAPSAPAPVAPPHGLTPADLPGAWTFMAPAVAPFDASLTIPVTLVGPHGQATTAMLIDTGASVTLVNGALADQLGLPNLGTDAVSGVGGSAAAYRSQVTIRIGDHVFADQPCVVDPSFTTAPPLLSIAFLEANGLGIALEPNRLRVTFFPEGGS